MYGTIATFKAKTTHGVISVFPSIVDEYVDNSMNKNAIPFTIYG